MSFGRAWRIAGACDALICDKSRGVRRLRVYVRPSGLPLLYRPGSQLCSLLCPDGLDGMDGNRSPFHLAGEAATSRLVMSHARRWLAATEHGVEHGRRL